MCLKIIMPPKRRGMIVKLKLIRLKRPPANLRSILWAFNAAYPLDFGAASFRVELSGKKPDYALYGILVMKQLSTFPHSMSILAKGFFEVTEVTDWPGKARHFAPLKRARARKKAPPFIHRRGLSPARLKYLSTAIPSSPCLL